MTVEQKKALLGEMPGFLQGAQIGQFNIFVESGAKVVYNEYAAQEEKKKGDMDPAAKDAIMDYVKRLMPIVREQYQGMYENMWLGILEVLCCAQHNSSYVAQPIMLASDPNSLCA